MNRWIWILALPYTIVYSTAHPNDGNYRLNHNGYDMQFTFVEKDVALDFAATLNEAHERRTYKKLWPPSATLTNNEDANPEKQIHRPANSRYLGNGVWENTNKSTGASALGSEPFDYKSACGQDDCGKEPTK